MYRKLIVISIVIAFAYVQIANSLTCQQCQDPNGCKTVNKVTCNNQTSNTTAVSLNRIFGSNIANANSTSSSFDCISQNVTSNGALVNIVKGCLAREAVQTNCSATHNCIACSGELCNANKSPAGTFSSSAFTMIATLLGVFIAKSFAV